MGKNRCVRMCMREWLVKGTPGWKSLGTILSGNYQIDNYQNWISANRHQAGSYQVGRSISHGLDILVER